MRPIDADELDKTIYEQIPIKVFGTVKRMAAMREIIQNAPTVDAVPVVRCKDCKYLIQTVFLGIKMNACRLHGSNTILPSATIVTDDWFCAGGERREE